MFKLNATKTVSKIIIGILFSCLLLYSCKDDDNTPSLNCQNGFEEIDGSCQCPEGMFEAYGNCRTLTEDEWYGVMKGCKCEDTMFVKISNIENGEARIEFNGNIDRQANGQLLPGGSGPVKYFELEDGDSIAPRGLPYGTLTCDVDGNISADFEGALYGKISPSRDKIDMLIEWRVRQTPTVIADSCYVTFRR